MNRARILHLLTLLLVSLFPANLAFAQGLEPQLERFRPYLEKQWEGYPVVPALSDPEFRSLSRWEVIIGGRAIRRIQEEPAREFAGEITYYLDSEGEGVAFLGLYTTGYVTRGTVSKEDGMIVMHGTQHGPTGKTEFRSTFQVLPTGEVEDRYYSLKDESWQLEHVIRYSPMTDEAPRGGNQ